MLALIPLLLAVTDPNINKIEYIVDFDDDATIEQITKLDSVLKSSNALFGEPWERAAAAASFRTNSIYSASHEKLYVISIDADKRCRRFVDKDHCKSVLQIELQELLPKLAEFSFVERIEENAILQAFDAPNDPMYDKQWSFKMVGAEETWRQVTGEGVVVAVIDTGVAFEDYDDFRQVEDLKGVSFAKGYDFVSDDEHPNDDHGHGTHVAGTIAQATNNGKGVAGLAYGATIMPIKVLSAFGGGTTADIADGIRFAVDNGAKVLNLSLGGGGRSEILAEAVAYAHEKGALVACAAGNDGRGTVEYPAAYPGATAVSSVGPTGKLAFYSSWGKEIALSAPGGDKNFKDGGILQNTIDPSDLSRIDYYDSFQGTSMATPHVAAAAALLASAGVEDPNEIEKILKHSATEAGEKGWDPKYGAGILSTAHALDEACELPSARCAASASDALWTPGPNLRRKTTSFVGVAGLISFLVMIALMVGATSSRKDSSLALYEALLTGSLSLFVVSPALILAAGGGMVANALHAGLLTWGLATAVGPALWIALISRK